jgi:transcriptional regulator with PAS, ATPase and Fis domain
MNGLSDVTLKIVFDSLFYTYTTHQNHCSMAKKCWQFVNRYRWSPNVRTLSILAFIVVIIAIVVTMFGTLTQGKTMS